MDLLQISKSLAMDVERLEFTSPVAFVYNPLVYAAEPHARYLARYGGVGREAVFVGMNPGPWGMAQTGVPFGEIDLVRNWLAIEGKVLKPPMEHPGKRIEGFDCHRNEVSGRRLWGLFRELFGTPEKFFERFFVVNYCPLLFLDANGRNITPDKLKASERDPLLEVCNMALRRTVEYMKPEMVIGVGNFAEKQIKNVLVNMSARAGKILHPSPANPSANRGWKETVLVQLREQGIEL